MKSKYSSANAKAMQSSNNAFVKKNQAAVASMQGKAPMLDEKYTNLDANMTSDGAHAQALARSLTAGIDSKAFPVK